MTQFDGNTMLLPVGEAASKSTDLAEQLTAVSIVIPAFREAANIGHVVGAVLGVARALDRPFELIVVDDGSTDDTAQVAEAAGATVIRHPYNLGYGAALKTGMRAARAPTLVILDADGQHDPCDIPALLSRKDGLDMVVGVRGGGGHSPAWRRPGKAFLGWMANGLTGHRIPDLNCGFRALDRKMALRLLPILPNGFSLSTTITIAAFHAGYTVGYVPIHVASRQGHTPSKVRLSDGFNTLMLILRIMSLFAPLKVFLPVAGFTLVVGLIFIVTSYVQFETSSIRGMLAVLASILFFLFGLLADQIAALRRGERVQDG